MGKSKIESYKGSVNRDSIFSRALAALEPPARALLFLSTFGCALSCADEDSGHAPPSSQAGAPSAGGGGSPQAAAGEGGSEEAAAGEGGSREPAAGNGGMGGTGGTGGTGASGGAGGWSPGQRCFDDTDCNDGLYCNGVELCKRLSPDSDVRVCMGPEHGPCGPSPCTEMGKCDCSEPDQDNDTFNVEGCTTDQRFDCDDDDADRYPGNPEDCDEHDEDCKETSVGIKDVDGDGYTDALCANRLFYQPLATSPQPLTAHGSDCNDDDEFMSPSSIEVCDKRDNNCNGETDEVSGAPGDAHKYYRDQDGDYWGSDEHPLDTLCNFPPPGYSTLHGDCNDANPRINPGREEICDGLNNDCNESVDQPEKPGDLMFGQPYDGITEFECGGEPGWKVKNCPPARLDCNGSYLDACERVATTLCDCHVCGRACAFSCGETDCEEIAVLSTGAYHTCAIVQPTGAGSAGGTLACWGRNASGQLGNRSTEDSVRAIRGPDLANVTALASGGLHSCAIAAGQRLFCWGSNEFGQLGAAIQEPFSIRQVEVYQHPPKLKVIRVSSGSSHTCAILEGGRLVCWGEGARGKLGNNRTDNTSEPVRVQRLVNNVRQFVDDALQVVAGDEHTCLLAGGRVECWGDNQSQQLGIDPEDLGSTPVALPVPGLEGIQVQELSASSHHTCARAGGDVYCWGSNLDRELALEIGDFGAPIKIPLPMQAVSIATGYAFGCALGSTGTVHCWGSNYWGERGISEDPPPVLPNPLALSEVTGIFAGRGSHVCAAKGDAGVSCWGSNDFGQLGNGGVSSLQKPAPSRVLALTGSQVCLFPN
jgi:alpha-tubulin suppressor-like RCC1 family protein